MKFNRTNIMVLGLLMTKPMNGYEIVQAAEKTTDLFWSKLSYGHIYPALKSLKEQGFVKVLEKSMSEKDQETITYTITFEGKSHLNAWIADHHTKDVTKSETLAKLFFSNEENIPSQLGVLSNLLKEMDHNLAVLQQQKEELERAIATQEQAPKNLIFQLIVLEFGLNYFEGLKKVAQRGLELLGEK